MQAAERPLSEIHNGEIHNGEIHNGEIHNGTHFGRLSRCVAAVFATSPILCVDAMEARRAWSQRWSWTADGDGAIHAGW